MPSFWKIFPMPSKRARGRPLQAQDAQCLGDVGFRYRYGHATFLDLLFRRNRDNSSTARISLASLSVLDENNSTRLEHPAEHHQPTQEDPSTGSGDGMVHDRGARETCP